LFFDAFLCNFVGNSRIYIYIYCRAIDKLQKYDNLCNISAKICTQLNRIPIEAQGAKVHRSNMQNGSSGGKGNLPKSAVSVLTLQAGPL